MSKRMKLECSNIPINAQWGRLFSCSPQLDSIDLVYPDISFGRAEDCDIVICKSTFLPYQLQISKKHFVISRDNEDKCIAYIRDVSKNGTYVNNIPIGRNKKIILQNNDTISVGEKLQVYVYKSMNTSVDDNYLPKNLRRKYITTRILGKGACGEVRLAYDKFTCQKYAIKKVIKGRDTASQAHSINHPTRLQTEIQILQSLDHPLTVQMREMAQTDDEIFLVLEYVQGGELSTRMKGSGMTEVNAKFFFYQMVLGVQYLHSQGITHRDLKPGNVLLASSDPYTLIKITDFGLSKLCENMKTICGTYHYMAPEIVNPHITVYDSQVDVWSLGVILFSMLSGTMPFHSKDKIDLLRLIIVGKYSMDPCLWCEISKEAKDLITKMLIVDPKNRITIDEILKHPWIAKDSLVHFTVEKLMKSSDYS